MELNILARPRLLAALICFGLGVLVLIAGTLGLPGSFGATQPEAAFDAIDVLGAAQPDHVVRPVLPANETVPIPDVIVYISGAVARPDVYRLPAGARVKDLVMAAGGLTAEAAPAQINLAQPVQDAGHIHVPSLHDQLAQKLESGVATGPAQTDNGLINLNTASAAVLEDLPGIGATLAERIIARRNEHGPFTAIEQLREVSGIGDKLYSQLAPLVTVGG
ncbi:MAG: helix-hairpin-helix domain-containing protein [Oscillochloridaceae bacterium umkhey_bin13]